MNFKVGEEVTKVSCQMGVPKTQIFIQKRSQLGVPSDLAQKVGWSIKRAGKVATGNQYGGKWKYCIGRTKSRMN